MSVTDAERRAMERALVLAATPGVPLGPNPRVGCVLLDADGTTLAEGHHRGAGTAHAEVDALTAAGEAARGATAVVTLEPCDHTGRTGPCTEALLAAGVRRVVYSEPDPTPQAAGGALRLRAAGVEAEWLPVETEVNRFWHFGLRHGRPFVTWKLATTLDGRSAAADGSSRWISNRAARLDAHRLRATADVMLVGTGTAETDDPRLTVRDVDDRELAHQPLRAVMGTRDLRTTLRVHDGAAETMLLRTRDPEQALAQLFERGRRHVFCEGGPTLAAAFLRAGLVDEVVAYVAPVLLGAGRSAVGDLGIESIGDALRLPLRDVAVLPGDDASDTTVRLTLGGEA